MFSGLPDQLVAHVHGLGHIGVVEQLSIVEHLALLSWRTALMTLSFVVRNIMFCLIIGSNRSFLSFRFDGDEILVRQFSVEMSESKVAKILEVRQTRIFGPDLNVGISLKSNRIVSVHEEQVETI
jgi:hypothetical protein